MSLSSPVQNLAIHLIPLVVVFFSVAVFLFLVRSMLCCFCYIWMFCLWFTCCLARISHVWVHDAISISAAWSGMAETMRVAYERKRFSQMKNAYALIILWVMWMQIWSTFLSRFFFVRMIFFLSTHFCVLSIWLWFVWRRHLCSTPVQIEECFRCPCVYLLAHSGSRIRGRRMAFSGGRPGCRTKCSIDASSDGRLFVPHVPVRLLHTSINVVVRAFETVAPANLE